MHSIVYFPIEETFANFGPILMQSMIRLTIYETQKNLVFLVDSIAFGRLRKHKGHDLRNNSVKSVSHAHSPNRKR